MYIDVNPVYEKVKEEILNLRESLKKKPKFVSLAVNPDPSTLAYLKSQKKSAKKFEIDHELILFESVNELYEKIEELNNDRSIDGIFISRPIEGVDDELKVIKKLNPEKDIEGITPYNLGMLFYGKELFPPCTAESSVLIMENIMNLKGVDALVIGRSITVGKPVAMMLAKKGRDATVTIAHSKTKNLKEKSLKSDVIVVAVGRAHFLKEDMVKDGAKVIDVGINFLNGKMVGDVSPEVSNKADVTPVPGGVGKITSLLLIRNVLRAAHLK